MPIEIAWTVAPMLIVFLLALILTRTVFEVRVNPDDAAAGLEAALRDRHRPSVVVGVHLRQV